MCKKILILCSLVLALGSQAQTATTIANLRTMVDNVNYLPTDTTTLWQTTGIVTTYTNLTTAPNALFYMQSGGAGIAVFFGGSTTVRPEAGDSVTVTGPLGQFNGLLELNLTTTVATHAVTTNSHNNALPAPTELIFSLTNNAAAIEALEGSYVVASNVFIQTGAAFTTGNFNLTNSMGETFSLRVDSRTDIVGKARPTGPCDIIGVLTQFDSADPRTEGYQLLPSRFADIRPKAPVTQFTNTLSNLVRPGDAVTSSTLTDYALRPTETITIQTRSFDFSPSRRRRFGCVIGP